MRNELFCNKAFLDPLALVLLVVSFHAFITRFGYSASGLEVRDRHREYIS